MYCFWLFVAGDISSIFYDPERKLLYTGSTDKTIRIVDTLNHKVVGSYQIGQPVSCISMHKDIIMVGAKKEVLLYSLTKGSVVQTLKAHSGEQKMFLSFFGSCCLRGSTV